MHDEDFSDHILRVSGGLFRALCPKACIVRWAHRERDAMNRHSSARGWPCGPMQRQYGYGAMHYNAMAHGLPTSFGDRYWIRHYRCHL